MSANILLAEDDPNLGFLTQEGLAEAGFLVDWRKDGQEALRAFQNQDLCIIDIMMPRMDGFTLAKHIRAMDEEVPILFLTAKSRENDRLKGFEIGGDDYILKPFSMKELVFRVEVFLKRRLNRKSVPIHSFNGCSFEFANLHLTIGEVTHKLTQREGELLNLLVQNKNELVKREAILEALWGQNDYFLGRSLDVFISRLRKYLKEAKGVEIKNHHGVGFQLQCQT